MLADMPWYDYSDEKDNKPGNKPEKESRYMDDFESPDDLRKYLETLND